MFARPFLCEYPMNVKHPPVTFPTETTEFFVGVRKIFQRIDKQLDPDLHTEQERTLVIIGGSALFLWMGSDVSAERAPTKDVDLLGESALIQNKYVHSIVKQHIEESELFKELDTQAKGVAMIPPDENVNRYDVSDAFDLVCLNVLLPHPFDLILSKFARYDDRDFVDADMLYEKYVAGLNHVESFVDYFYITYPFLHTRTEQFNFQTAFGDIVGKDFEESLICNDPSNI